MAQQADRRMTPKSKPAVRREGSYGAKEDVLLEWEAICKFLSLGFDSRTEPWRGLLSRSVLGPCD